MVSFCASKEKKGLPSGEKIYVFGKSSRLARPMQWKWDRGTSSYHADSSDALQQWETTELSSNPGIKRYKSAMRTGTLTEIPPRANIGAFNSIDKDKVIPPHTASAFIFVSCTCSAIQTTHMLFLFLHAFRMVSSPLTSCAKTWASPNQRPASTTKLQE